jgi:recombinational DNA repair protein (RecF pathway)
MTTISIDTSRCALCDRHVSATKYAGLFVVGPHAAIGYALCKNCGKQATHGLPPALLRHLDTKLEAEAARFGLAQTN